MSGAIIPFSSGLPVELATVDFGVNALGVFLGHGQSALALTNFGDEVNLIGPSGLMLNLAFSIPRDGILESFALYFSNVVAQTLTNAELTIAGHIFVSPAPGTLFLTIPSARLELPAITGNVDLGKSFSAIRSNIHVPLIAGTRILVVLTMFGKGEGLSFINTLTGYVSGGLEIL